MSGVAIGDVLNRLTEHEGQPRRSGDQWSARCPAHHDHNPSLSIAQGEDGKVLLTCHAGCDLDAILGSLGLTVADLAGSNGHDRWTAAGTEVARYEYVDESGAELFTVHRADGKRFRQSRPDSTAKSGRRWKLDDTRWVLYRLPEVLAAVERGDTVYVVEGEKDVQAIERAGAVATCNPGGAGKWLHRHADPPYREALAGARVVVVADRDPTGADHAAAVAADLADVCDVTVVQAVEGKDAADHLGAGHGLDDLVPADHPPADSGAKSGPPWQHPAYDGAAYLLDAPADVPAVWGDGDDILWAAGEPLLLCGPTGVGKTTIGQQLALARIGLRDQVLGRTVTPARRVLYIAADRPEQARRSMQRMVEPADRDTLYDRLAVWRGPLPFDIAKGDPGALAEFVAGYAADAVIIDSLKDVAIKLTDDEVGARVNAALQHTLEVADVAPLHHLRKNPSGQQRQPQSIDELYGSVWIPAGAGSVLVLWGEPGDAIVDMTHLKQPKAAVGPVKVRHDHDTGRSTVIAEPDALDIVRAAPRGVSVADVARIVHDTTDPDRNQIERARRRLDKLVARGLATKRPASDGRAGGTTPTLYVPVDDRREQPA